MGLKGTGCTISRLHCRAIYIGVLCHRTTAMHIDNIVSSKQGENELRPHHWTGWTSGLAAWGSRFPRLARGWPDSERGCLTWNQEWSPGELGVARCRAICPVPCVT
jgi:hypothetical protein